MIGGFDVFVPSTPASSDLVLSVIREEWPNAFAELDNEAGAMLLADVTPPFREIFILVGLQVR